MDGYLYCLPDAAEDKKPKRRLKPMCRLHETGVSAGVGIRSQRGACGALAGTCLAKPWCRAAIKTGACRVLPVCGFRSPPLGKGLIPLLCGAMRNGWGGPGFCRPACHGMCGSGPKSGGARFFSERIGFSAKGMGDLPVRLKKVSYAKGVRRVNT